MQIRDSVTRPGQIQHGGSIAGQTWQPSAGNVVPGLCPRMDWRSVNPALPPPETLTCLARGPDCCVNSAVADAWRVA